MFSTFPMHLGFRPVSRFREGNTGVGLQLLSNSQKEFVALPKFSIICVTEISGKSSFSPRSLGFSV